MLEKLHDIPWRKLTHAHGKASDTPRLIRGLASKSQWRRNNARNKLWFSITHQGSVYEAAAYAVPFLVELASSPAVADRDEILLLLKEIACGSGWHQNHEHLEVVRRAFGDKRIEEGIRKETGWVKLIWDAVSNSAGAVIELLDDKDPKVRMQAANLLTVIPSAADRSVERMKRALSNETDTLVRANLIMTISHLAARSEAALFREHFDRAPDTLTRMVSAMGIIASDVQNPSSEALLALVEILRAKDNAVRGQFDRLPISAGYLAELAAYLTLAPENLKAQAAELLVAERESMGGFGGETLDVLMLRMVLPIDASQLRAENLTDIQRRAITCVARSAWPNEKTLFGNAHDVLAAFKLPQHVDTMDALLGNELAKLGAQTQKAEATLVEVLVTRRPSPVKQPCSRE